MPKGVPRWPGVHENDVLNAPLWCFAPGMSMTRIPAARFLGICKNSLVRYADIYGLSVIREPITANRFFLVSELKALKRLMDEANIADLLAEPKKKSRKWNGKEGWSNGLLGSVKKRTKRF
jgi:hypothetical protein